AKVGSPLGVSVMNKIISQEKTLSVYLHNNSSSGKGHITYHRSPVFWIRAMDFEPYFKSETRDRSLDHIRDLYFEDMALARRAGGVISSTIFYLWFTVQGNCRNIAGNDVENVSVGDLKSSKLAGLEQAFSSF